MASDTRMTIEEMERWARAYGLGKLGPEHVARLAELSVYVAALGAGLPRVPGKEDAPAPAGSLVAAPE